MTTIQLQSTPIVQILKSTEMYEVNSHGTSKPIYLTSLGVVSAPSLNFRP